MSKENEKLNSYADQLKDDPQIQIVDSLKQKYSDFQILSFLITLGFIGCLANLLPFVLIENLFCLFFLLLLALWITGCIKIACHIEENYEQLSKQKTLRVIEQAEGYEIQEILLKEYEKRGFLYQKQVDIALDYINCSKEIEAEEKLKSKLNENDSEADKENI